MSVPSEVLLKVEAHWGVHRVLYILFYKIIEIVSIICVVMKDRQDAKGPDFWSSLDESKMLD